MSSHAGLTVLFLGQVETRAIPPPGRMSVSRWARIWVWFIH
ncbi:hypothetical protein ACFRSX_38045 [Streptomyces goshikiensis]|nr:MULTISPECIES: hypothetical protein [unclassified Streptomyces]